MEAEDLDDDMVVLIVGDEANAASDDGEVEVKLEKSETTDEEMYFKTDKNYKGKQPVVEKEDEDNPLWSDDEPSLRGFDEEEHLEEIFIVDSECKPIKNPANVGTKRTRMIKATARHSRIQELIRECPSLNHNEDELVNRVADIMMKTKPPKPPSDFVTCETNEDGLCYVCSTCKKKGSNMMEVARHWQEQHGERYLKCFACGVDFRATSCLHRHEKRCLSKDAVIVLKARAIAVGNKGRARPYLKPKIKKKKVKYIYKKTFNCSMCPATFTSRMPLDAHENLHRGDRPYTCEFCLLPYGSYTALNRHRQTHGEQVFICDHCERSFKTKHLLISHLQTHNERRFVCNDCGNKYSTKLARHNHVWRVHLNLPPPAACPVCPKRYARNSNLKLHMKDKHGMELITRNMYIKSASKLTEMELKKAKVVMKSESTDPPYVIPEGYVVPVPTNRMVLQSIDEPNKGKQKIEPAFIGINMDNIEETIVPKPEMITCDLDSTNDDQDDDDDDEIDENQIIVDITDSGVSEHVLEFVKKLQVDAVEEHRKVQVVLMDNGRVVHLVESNDDANRLMEKFKEKGATVEVEKSDTET